MQERLASAANPALRKNAMRSSKVCGDDGAIARGVVTAGGGTPGDDSTAGRIQDVLLEKHPRAPLGVRACGGKGEDLFGRRREEARRRIPPSFTAFYRRHASAGELPDIKAVEVFDDGAYAPASLERVVSDTEMWRRIQREQPSANAPGLRARRELGKRVRNGD